MKPYNVEVDATTRWTIRIDADSEDEAWLIAGGMDTDEIESGDCFKELRDVEVVSVEEITDVD